MNMNEQYPLMAPAWLIKLVRQAKLGQQYSLGQETRNILLRHHLNTVCDSASCPNRPHCFSLGTATFMILGAICTRNCTFCAVTSGSPEKVDSSEADRIKESVQEMGLTHVVITSVTRDDLPDSGAGQFAAVVHALRSVTPPVSIEVLLPDFQGSLSDLRTVLDVAPDIVAHNMETVERFYPIVRPAADYQRSLRILSYAAKERKKGMFVKSGFMVGLGEEDEEIFVLMRDLRETGVTMLTIGQYLAPSLRHYQVRRFISPGEFAHLEDIARSMGFVHVAAGPLVRSSYHAGVNYKEAAADVATVAAH
ncbi:MAG: lipoyl synthase [Proteobacteria bacterium]|nr:lipoyl synthase [Pseudomonadota bacterium]